MRKGILAVFVLLFVAAVAVADDVPKVEVFGGYSMERLGYSDVSSADLASLFDSFGATGNFEMKKFLKKGFLGSVTFNVTDVFGIEADFRWNKDDILKGTIDVDNTTVSAKAKYSDFGFLVGPRFALRKSDKVTPFAHALIGIDRANVSVEASAMGQSASTDVGSDTGFGLALGGGLDVNVNKHFGIRLIQADYFFTKHSDENFNNFALAFGAVFRF